MSFAIDLVCLAADTNIKETLAALLNRPQALGIRPIQYQLAVHPEHDPGCARHGADFLRPFQSRAQHALIIFDRAGSGRENLDRNNLEAELEDRLRSAGWEDRAAAIAIDPELENWIWSDSPHVTEVLGWSDEKTLRDFLARSGFWSAPTPKPQEPKEAVEAALLQARIPRSSSIYRQLAAKVSFRRCTDPAFQKLCATLQKWFGSDPAG